MGAAASGAGGPKSVAAGRGLAVCEGLLAGGGRRRVARLRVAPGPHPAAARGGAPWLELGVVRQGVELPRAIWRCLLRLKRREPLPSLKR